MTQHIHIEETLDGAKGPHLAQQAANLQREYLQDAQDATDEEHDLNLLKAIRLYPKAIAWYVTSPFVNDC